MNISWGQVAVLVIGIVLAQFVIDWYQNRQTGLEQSQNMPTLQERVEAPRPPQTVDEYVRLNYPNAL